MDYETKLELLRQEYRDKPWKRQVILRMVRALELSVESKQLKIDKNEAI